MKVSRTVLKTSLTGRLVRLSLTNWKSFFKANQEYNPDKFKGKLPKYKDKGFEHCLLINNAN